VTPLQLRFEKSRPFKSVLVDCQIEHRTASREVGGNPVIQFDNTRWSGIQQQQAI